MHFSSLRGTLVVFLIAYFNTDVAAISGDDLETHRLLRAATKRSDLYRRGVRITKRFETELAYVENENVWNDESTFASQVKVSSQRPLLNLEEHEHHLQDVQCSDDTMKLHFVDTSSARDARSASHGGLIITSHESCNEEGERSVYRVNDVSFAKDGEALELSVSKTTWQAAFDYVDISFGHTTEDHVYRRHSDFARLRHKRQSRVDIPADTPDNVNTVTLDLGSELLNTTFGIESFLSAISGVIPVPDVPLPIEIGCKRCTTSGQIALTQGAFKIDASQIDLIPDVFQGGDDGKEITSVITGGFIELVATGVGARMELFARPVSSGGFEIALFQVPIAGFVIPGIGKAGAVFEPRIAFDFEISGTLEVNYGLEVTVPDGSSLRVELADLASSRLTGFQESRLTPLPVEVNVTDAEILLGLAFIPSIPIGFEFLDQLTGEITPSLQLPRLDAKLSSNIVENCGGGSNNTYPGVPYANHTAELSPELLRLGPLALVEANISLAIDIALDVSLPVLPPPFNAVGIEENIFTAVFPLLSSCASPDDAFNNATGVLVPPPVASNTLAAPGLNATMGMARAGNTATRASAEAAAPTLSPGITFVFASDVVSSTSELIATSTPISTTLSETSLVSTTSTLVSSTGSTTSLTNTTSTPVSYTAYTSSLNATSTMESETVSTPCTSSMLYSTSTIASEISSTPCTSSLLYPTSTMVSETISTPSSSLLYPTSKMTSEMISTPCSTCSSSSSSSSLYPTSTMVSEKSSTTCTTSLNSTSTLIDYTVSATPSPATTTSTAAYGYAPSSPPSLNTTTALYDSPSTSFTTRTTYVIVTPSSVATSTSSSLASTLGTGNSTSSASQYATVVPVYSAETSVEPASPTSSPHLSSAFIPAYNTSSPAIPVLSPSSSADSITPVVSAQPVVPEDLPPLAPVVTMTVGFLVPSNGSAVPVQQTGLPVFTGAATRVVSVSKTKVMLGWLVGVVGFCAMGPLSIYPCPIDRMRDLFSQASRPLPREKQTVR